MGFIRPPAVRSGDYIESIFGEYSAGKTKPSRKLNSAKFVTALTCLQFAFAVYATGLLYYMSPSIDLRAKPDFTWATKWAHNMRSYIVTPHVVSHYQDSASFLKSENFPVMVSPAEVCEYEKIDFSQKKIKRRENDQDEARVIRRRFGLPEEESWVREFRRVDEDEVKMGFKWA
jgi:hypothetical protein